MNEQEAVTVALDEQLVETKEKKTTQNKKKKKAFLLCQLVMLTGSVEGTHLSDPPCVAMFNRVESESIVDFTDDGICQVGRADPQTNWVLVAFVIVIGLHYRAPEDVRQSVRP